MFSRINFRSVFGIFIPLFALLFLIFYGANTQPDLTLTRALEKPAFYDGHSLFIGTEAVITRIENDGFYMSYLGKRFWVQGLDTDLRVGDFIHMKAVFHKQGWLELIECYVPDNRRLKILYSILPLPIIVFLLFWYWRLGKSGLCPRGSLYA